MDKRIKFTACDPDGHRFGYSEQPYLGFNFSDVETWLCPEDSRCFYLGKEKVSDFKKSLVIV